MRDPLFRPKEGETTGYRGIGEAAGKSFGGQYGKLKETATTAQEYLLGGILIANLAVCGRKRKICNIAEKRADLLYLFLIFYENVLDKSF